MWNCYTCVLRVLIDGRSSRFPVWRHQRPASAARRAVWGRRQGRSPASSGVASLWSRPVFSLSNESTARSVWERQNDVYRVRFGRYTAPTSASTSPIQYMVSLPGPTRVCPGLAVLETAVFVSRPLETEILRSWSWHLMSWSRSSSIGLGCFRDRSIIDINFISDVMLNCECWWAVQPYACV